MIKVVGVRFRNVGKNYYFDPKNLEIKAGDYVIVETARGLEYGQTTLGIRLVNEEDVVQPLKPVIRIATEDDKKKFANNKASEKEAYKICLGKIAKHHLEMKLIDVEYSFDNSKILFYFTADGRVDFRELVKDLAATFHTRIELRQIGVRDESRITGGLGVCGRPYCCHQVNDKLRPVSIRMAKEQNLSLNSMKISGQCGRLLCCLSYEYDWYAEAKRTLPNEGTRVQYDGTMFRINEVNPITSMVKMSGDDGRLLEVNASRFTRKGNRWEIN